MSARKSSDNLPASETLAGKRTWIEISKSAARHNFSIFRRLIGRSELWPVVKSNAYGHGIFIFAWLMQEFGADGLCVDSALEAFALRKRKIKIPLLVLGPTLPVLFREALREKVIITVSNPDSLKELARSGHVPFFHLKIDTGMHRQGFYPEQIASVIKIINSHPQLGKKLNGVYTHFASATSLNNKAYTEFQFLAFEKVRELFEKEGYKNLVWHSSATGGTLLGKNFHLDMVRVGKGLYGFPPSRELEKELRSLKLKPVLSWRAIISEIKDLKPGDLVGYDLTEKIKRPTRSAVLPVGYWHGFPRQLSGAGEVIVAGKRARVLGRVSMDLLVVDVTGIKCRVGDVATLIGKSGKDVMDAREMAKKSGTISYEILTRLNPLIERVIIR